ncbi:MAG: UDP-N-acetylmuramoyl-tripeptide--D-alanyl-D-alanine ligase, partial [Phycisphaerae bacterium]
MQPLTLDEIIKAMSGRPLGAPPTRSITSVGTDSRRVRQDELFVALKGPRFDGHRYVPNALAAGAAAAVVTRRSGFSQALRTSGRLIVVSNTRDALARLAAYYRGLLAASVIAVTGSNGKTTCKNMIHHVLSARRTGRAAPASYNNDVGVPMTILSAEPTDEYLVVEIGTNAPGEVSALSRIVRPDVAVVVSLGEAHLELLGDLARVAEEETSVLEFVQTGGMAIVHSDAAYAASRYGAAGLNVIRFGPDRHADLRVNRIAMSTRGLRFRVNERFGYSLPTIGPHNAVNALAAIAVGRRFGMDHAEIADRLRSFQPPEMRLNVSRIGAWTVIDDTYNANPASTEAAIRTLRAWPTGRRKVL